MTSNSRERPSHVLYVYRYNATNINQDIAATARNHPKVSAGKTLISQTPTMAITNFRLRRTSNQVIDPMRRRVNVRPAETGCTRPISSRDMNGFGGTIKLGSQPVSKYANSGGSRPPTDADACGAAQHYARDEAIFIGALSPLCSRGTNGQRRASSGSRKVS